MFPKTNDGGGYQWIVMRGSMDEVPPVIIDTRTMIIAGTHMNMHVCVLELRKGLTFLNIRL
jgi:hypothetical protein